MAVDELRKCFITDVGFHSALATSLYISLNICPDDQRSRYTDLSAEGIPRIMANNTLPSQIYAVSLARFIVDDIVYADGSRVDGVLGGGGLHAVFGMRYWWPPPRSKHIGFVLHIGLCEAMTVDEKECSDMALHETVLYGTVSAGLTVEQVDMASRTVKGDNVGYWNKASIQTRLLEVRQRYHKMSFRL